MKINQSQNNNSNICQLLVNQEEYYDVSNDKDGDWELQSEWSVTLKDSLATLEQVHVDCQREGKCLSDVEPSKNQACITFMEEELSIYYIVILSETDYYVHKS